jgi:hypothetical protein
MGDVQYDCAAVQSGRAREGTWTQVRTRDSELPVCAATVPRSVRFFATGGKFKAIDVHQERDVKPFSLRVFCLQCNHFQTRVASDVSFKFLINSMAPAAQARGFASASASGT